MTSEWSDLDPLGDFATISLAEVIVLFAAILIPLPAYNFSTMAYLVETFLTIWGVSLVAYYLLNRAGIEHALVDNIVAVVLGFLVGSPIAFQVFYGTISPLWIAAIGTTGFAVVVVAVIFVAFFQIVTRRLGD